MPSMLKTTDHDHIPEDFTLEGLNSVLSPDEVRALMGGDDPILQAMSDGEGDPAPQQQAPAAQNPADPVQQAQPQAQPQPNPAQQEAPKQPQLDHAALQRATATLNDGDAKIAALDTKLEELTERYDIGELSREQFMSESRTLAKEQAALQMQMEQAQQAVQTYTQQAHQAWFDTLDSWKASTGAEFLWSQEHFDNWNDTLITINKTPAYQQLPHDKRIELAYDLYNANVKAVTGKPLPALKAPAPGGQPKPQQGQPRQDEREPLQTLGGFNTDSAASITDGTFASIDRTMEQSPLMAEALFSRMTPEQQAAFLEQT